MSNNNTTSNDKEVSNSLPNNPISGRTDMWNGVNVDHNSLPDDPAIFGKLFSECLTHWKKIGRRVVWLLLPLNKSGFVPVAAKLGFRFHHVGSPDQLMMTKWLPDLQPDEEERIPDWATCTIGAGAFVINTKKQLLVVQEKFEFLKNRLKLPGGYVKLGEDLHNAAIREVKEECNVDCEFIKVVGFRHMHPHLFGAGDFYFVCLMRALSDEIKIDPHEIQMATWMDIEEYMQSDRVHDFNKKIARLVYERSGLFKENPSQELIQLEPLSLVAPNNSQRTFNDFYF